MEDISEEITANLSSDQKIDMIMKVMIGLQGLKSLPEAVEKMNNLLIGVQSDVNKANSAVASLERKYTKQEERVMKLESRIDYLENQSRRDNLVFRGIDESDGETSNICKMKVVDCIREMGIFVTEREIDRAHRVNSKTSPRPMVVKFNEYSTREKVFKKKASLKGSKIVIYEDFSKKVLNERRELVKHMKTAREEGLYAMVSFNRLIIGDPENVNKQDLYQFDEVSKELIHVGTRTRGPEANSNGNADRREIQRDTETPENEGDGSKMNISVESEEMILENNKRSKIFRSNGAMRFKKALGGKNDVKKSDTTNQPRQGASSIKEWIRQAAGDKGEPNREKNNE